MSSREVLPPYRVTPAKFCQQRDPMGSFVVAFIQT